MAESHKIRRAVMDLRYPDEETAFRVRSRLEDVFFAQVMPVLEEVFDVFGDRVVEIGRLEVDLGSIDPLRLDSAHLRQALLAEVEPILRAANDSAAEGDMDVLLLNAFKHFLAHGDLPWYSPFVYLSELEEAIRSLRPSDRLAEVSRPLLASRPVRRRLTRQFSTVMILHILDALEPIHADSIVRAAADMLQDGDQKDVLTLALEAAVASPTTSTTTPEEIQSIIQIRSTPPRGPLSDAGEESAAAAAVEDAAESDPIYVALAGAVLLHPFLDRLFGALQLLGADGAFVSDEHRERAVHVLYHVSTGAEQPEEQQTILLKLMCGLPLTFPIARDLELTSAERDEADTLLKAVIEHWSALKNTSPAALRETFIQREGKLEREGNAWRLAVEQRSVDVLLASLPWNLAIMRSPWMPSPLWIDWA